MYLGGKKGLHNKCLINETGFYEFKLQETEGEY